MTQPPPLLPLSPQPPAPPPPPPSVAAEPRGLVITVAGATGGAGTTTIAALLADAITHRTGNPVCAIDHVGGTFSSRLATTHPASRFIVHDLGPLAAVAARQTTTPERRTIIVTSPDAGAADLALDSLRHLAANTPIPPPDQHQTAQHLIIVNTTSRHKPPQTATRRLQAQAPGAAVIALAWDPALATAGPIDHTAVTAETIDTVARALQQIGV